LKFNVFFFFLAGVLPSPLGAFLPLVSRFTFLVFRNWKWSGNSEYYLLKFWSLVITDSFPSELLS
jgi:hypothetical protein